MEEDREVICGFIKSKSRISIRATSIFKVDKGCCEIIIILKLCYLKHIFKEANFKQMKSAVIAIVSMNVCAYVIPIISMPAKTFDCREGRSKRVPSLAR